MLFCPEVRFSFSVKHSSQVIVSGDGDIQSIDAGVYTCIQYTL